MFLNKFIQLKKQKQMFDVPVTACVGPSGKESPI